MKRFFLFSGYNYYPSGGRYDLVGDFDSVSEAVSMLQSGKVTAEWWHVLDTNLRETYSTKLKGDELLGWAKDMDEYAKHMSDVL